MRQVRVGDNLLKATTVIFDALLVVLGYYIAFIVIFQFEPEQRNLDAFFDVAPFLIVAVPVIFDIYGLYKVLKKTVFEVLSSLLISILFVAVFTAAAAFFVRGFAFPRSVLVVAPVIQFIILAIWRTSVWKLRRLSHGRQNIMVLGDKSEAEAIIKKIFLTNRPLYNICYYDSTAFSANRVDISHTMETLAKMLFDAKEIFICSSIDPMIKREIVSLCIKNNKRAYIVPSTYDIMVSKAKISNFDDAPVYQVSSVNLTIEQRTIKRAFDIVLSIFGIVISSPVMLVTAIAIVLNSRGPILYSQERVTRGGKVFRLYKFRTMKADAEKLSGPVLAKAEDPRITAVGKVLRTFRLDELPQFFNVLRGDMSFVGPRPERPFFVKQFESEIPDYGFRHKVKAGITGMAQVQGKYSTVVSDKLRYDLMYISEYSFLLDVKIILQTIKTLFAKENTQGVSDEMPLEELLEQYRYYIREENGISYICER